MIQLRIPSAVALAVAVPGFFLAATPAHARPCIS
jgi:hypothetical protein